MTSWKTHSNRTTLSAGKWLTVEMRTVETPDGQVIKDWPWVITPDFINVVAVTEAGRLLLFRQGKYGLEGESLAPVGGYIEPGEDPLDAAKRELHEETGYTASEWVSLSDYLVDPNRGVARGYIFLAYGARKIAEPTADDLEAQELLELMPLEVESALREGQVKVLSWAFSITAALHEINR